MRTPDAAETNDITVLSGPESGQREETLRKSTAAYYGSEDKAMTRIVRGDIPEVEIHPTP
jgi:hypothetical protein